MLTLRELGALTPSADTLVLSVYLDGRVSDPAARDHWARWLDGALRAERRRLRDAPPGERDAFERAATRLLDRLPPRDRAIGASAWVAFATPDAVLHASAVQFPTTSLVAWQHGAYVAPYAGALRTLRPVIVAATNTKHATTYRVAQGAVTPIATLRTNVRAQPAMHMGSAPRAGFHTGTRGATGVDAAERRRLAALDRMIASLCDQLANAVAADDAWLVLGGTPDAVRRLHAALPEPLRERAWIAPSLADGASAADVAAAAEAGAAALRDAEDAAEVRDVLDRYGDDTLGAAGPDAVRRALSQRNVRELFVTPRFLAAQVADANAIVCDALQHHATIATIGGPTAERLDRDGGGVAARLRFVAPPLVVPLGAPAMA